MAVLIDTSFLLAAMFIKDENHARAREALRNLKVTRIVPAPVVYELFYRKTALSARAFMGEVKVPRLLANDALPGYDSPA